MHQVAIVGCAHIHTPGFIKRLNNRSDTQVKFTWDHDPERARKSAEAVKAQAVTDLNAIWSDPAIEAVIICSETNRHQALVEQAAAANKHMFVEKPLGLGAADSFKMAQAIEQAGVLFQTGYFMRSDAINRFLCQQIQAGSFGKISRIRHTNCHDGSLEGKFDTEWRWMADLSQAGIGGFGDLGTHSLDILMWLMGDVERVTATIHTLTGRYGDCDEFGEGLLEFNGGVVGSLAAGWVDMVGNVNLIVSGTDGLAYVANGSLYFKSKHVKGADGEKPWTDLPPALPHAFELFLDALEDRNNVPLVTAQEAAARSAVMEAMYQASKQQAWTKPAKNS